MGSRGRGGRRRGICECPVRGVCAWSQPSCFQCDAPCGQLTKMDQSMSSCGPSVRIICIPPPPPSMHRIARFVCNPHAVRQQLLPSTCAEEFEAFSQFLFAHMTASQKTQQHPGKQQKQLPPSCSADMFCGNGFCQSCVQRNSERASEKMSVHHSQSRTSHVLPNVPRGTHGPSRTVCNQNDCDGLAHYDTPSIVIKLLQFST